MKVHFFVTCLADQFFAEAAADAVRLLRHLGCDVSFAPDQACCGQSAFNGGHRPHAVTMAEQTCDVYAGKSADIPIVLPSGSCSVMIKHHFADLVGADTVVPQAHELSRFIVEVLKVTNLGNGLAGKTVALHQGCHALRSPGHAPPCASAGHQDDPSRILLETAGASVVEWAAEEECCGFGGLFSVKLPDVSAAMADRKLETLPSVDLVVSADPGCLLQLQGRARMRRTGTTFAHIATVLWQAVDP